ncbi:cell division protein FtsQ/DivIB [Nocardia sp. 348MFTsu5.1]|uniref:cell division protein FtsQ/DivIB n=1 Tax=Nocardia sp. 348MFTsu5.1 TaxID=1172185 RepID=UPI0003A64A26|nr:FtsQ-type POTRA domain-containing protein [Nocardia sp. 348MFTsu5.1]
MSDDDLDPEAFDADFDDADAGKEDAGSKVDKNRRRGFARRSRRRGPARPAISGMRVLVGTVVTTVVVIGLFLVAYFTPLMSVRTVDVTGNSVVAAEEITSAAAIPEGEPLLQVDAAAAAQRVSRIPRVASARVKREYPSTISIAIEERVPVVFTERDGQKYLMDKLGFEFAQQDPPPGLAQLRTPNPGSGDPSTRAALTVMAEVPPYVAEQIAAVEVSSPVNIVLVLKDNRTVVWGDDSRNAEKSETLRHVLTQEGTEYNVSSPSNPTFK